MIFTQPIPYEFPLVTARTLLIIGQRDRTAFAGGASENVRATLGNYPYWAELPHGPSNTPSWWRSPVSATCHRSKRPTNTPRGWSGL
jgi:hypothetical protein